MTHDAGVSLEQELRDALAALLRAREHLIHERHVEMRPIIQRELATSQVALARVLHLIGGHHDDA